LAVRGESLEPEQVQLDGCGGYGEAASSGLGARRRNPGFGSVERPTAAHSRRVGHQKILGAEPGRAATTGDVRGALLSAFARQRVPDPVSTALVRDILAACVAEESLEPVRTWAF